MGLPYAATGEKLCSPSTRRFSLLPAIALVLSLTSALAFVHGQNSPPTQDEEIIRVRTDLVAVPFVVQDSRGRRIAGLTATDFLVFDENRRVEPSYFAAGTERVALLFLLDASGSTRDAISRQREAALGLFERFGSRSRVAVMHFAEQAALTLPFTDAVERARPAFSFAARPDSRTAIFDSALAALEVFKADPAHTTERRIVILLSDGLDTISRVRPRAVIEEARRRNVSFYVLHLPLYWAPEGRLRLRRPASGFRDLAEQTGGRFLVVGDERTALSPSTQYDLRPVFEAVAADLSAQYVVGFYAREAEAGSGPRRVIVRLVERHQRRLRVKQLRESYVPQAGAQ